MINFEKNSKNFFVEEIFPGYGVIGLNQNIKKQGYGDYTWFSLQKEDWNTVDIAKTICRKLNVSKKRINYSGMKDRQATTTQLMSVWKVPPEKVMQMNITGVKINGAWNEEKDVKMGDAVGNRFKIVINTDSSIEKSVFDKYNQLDGIMPNYFGEQRFGMLNNTNIVGKNIVIGDFEGAVKEYLCGGDSRLEKNEEAREARENLKKNWGDFGIAIKNYPKYLKYERTLLSHLTVYPKDYIGALRKLPRKLSLLFVHSHQSSTFNEELRVRIEKNDHIILADDNIAGLNEYMFPDEKKLVLNNHAGEKVTIKNGYYPLGIIHGYENGDESFKIKSFPEISSKGSNRFLFVPIVNFKFSENENIGTFNFDLPSGSYATVALSLFTNE